MGNVSEALPIGFVTGRWVNVLLDSAFDADDLPNTDGGNAVTAQWLGRMSAEGDLDPSRKIRVGDTLYNIRDHTPPNNLHLDMNGELAPTALAAGWWTFRVNMGDHDSWTVPAEVKTSHTKAAPLDIAIPPTVDRVPPAVLQRHEAALSDVSARLATVEAAIADGLPGGGGGVDVSAIEARVDDVEADLARYQVKQTFDVRDQSGYVDDWRTDNTEAIQAAIDAAEAAGGGVVALPAGRRIKVTGLDVKTHVTLMGLGLYTRLFQEEPADPAVTVPPILSVGAGYTEVGVQRLWLQGNARTPYGMLIDNATGDRKLLGHHAVAELRVEGVGGTGFRMGDYVRDSSISELTLRSCGKGLEWASNDSRLTNAYISQCSHEGLHVSGGASDFVGVKVWYCGKIADGGGSDRPAGVLIEGIKNNFTNLVAQENYSVGVHVFRSGKTLHSLSFNGLMCDSNNLAGNGSGQFLSYNMARSQVRGTFVKSDNLGHADGGTYAVSCGGPEASGNIFDINVSGIPVAVTDNSNQNNTYIINGALPNTGGGGGVTAPIEVNHGDGTATLTFPDGDVATTYHGDGTATISFND